MTKKGIPNPKISAALKISEKARIQQDRFRFNNPMKGKSQKGIDNHNFKGTNYQSLHMSLNTWYGKTQKCEFCSKVRDDTKRRDIDWANVTGEYNLERKNWKTLCTKCHSKFDQWCVAVISGGLDSTTLLYWLKKQQKMHIEALSFDYGQRHKKELEFAKATCEKLGVSHKVINVTFLNQLMQGSALTSKDINVPHGHYEAENMKLTVVPNRNMTMTSIAVAYAVSIGAGKVFIGVHAGDFHIYPDCRPEFIEAMNEVTKISNYIPVRVEAPFLNIDKGDIVKIGRILEVDYSLTWTCYEGKSVPCGKCGADMERKYAFDKAKMRDPLEWVPPPTPLI